MSAKKKKFSITLTDSDEQRVRLAAALEGRGFSSMVVLLVREALKRRGVKAMREKKGTVLDDLPPVLDACCGARMFWFDKENPNAVFCDNRQVSETLCDGRILRIEPDIQCDFKALPFPDESFRLVVFDPPHLKTAGPKSWQGKKYGVLPKDWGGELRQGFRECFRVLAPHGVLVFKWSEAQILLSAVLGLTPEKPLFGDRRAGRGGQWVVFMKGRRRNGEAAEHEA